MVNWKNVYVFISSTFNDMQAERDYLSTYVFPELKSWCAKYKINLIDVDLRWGITEEDAKINKRTVEICLNNIDISKPIFLCFLGQRRGWVPQINDVASSLFIKYPEIHRYIGKCSMTELEIMHACFVPLNNDLQMYHSPLFFIRDSSYLSNIKDDTFLHSFFCDNYDCSSLLKKIREKFSSNRIFTYSAKWEPSSNPSINVEGQKDNATISMMGHLTDFKIGGNTLKNILVENIKTEIERLYPEHFVNNILNERMNDVLQENFHEQALLQYIPREDYFDLQAYLNNDSPDYPLYVIAPHGFGKTTLLSKAVQEYYNKEGTVVVRRFLGVDGRILSEEALITDIISELQILGLLKRELPYQDSKTLCSDFYNLLNDASINASHIILIIDGIDQLGVSMDKLLYLPSNKCHVKIVISCSTESISGKKQLSVLDLCHVMTIHRLTAEEKKQLINTYFSNYLKKVDDEMIFRLLQLPGTGNPLYLKILLSEMRICGSFEQIQSYSFSDYGTTPISAFEAIISRLITKEITVFHSFNGETTKNVLLPLACANADLTLTEYRSVVQLLFKNQIFCVEEIDEFIQFYIVQLQDFIVFENGLFRIRYHALKETILLHFSSEKARCHFLLFESMRDIINNGSVPIWELRHAYSQLVYHLSCSNRKELLCRYLFDDRFILNKAELCSVYELIDDYRYLDDEQALHIKDVLIFISSKLNHNSPFFRDEFSLLFLERINKKYKKQFHFPINTYPYCGFVDNSLRYTKQTIETIVDVVDSGDFMYYLTFYRGKITINQILAENGRTIRVYPLNSELNIILKVGPAIYGKSPEITIASMTETDRNYGAIKRDMASYTHVIGYKHVLSVEHTMNSRLLIFYSESVLYLYNYRESKHCQQKILLNEKVKAMLCNEDYLLIKTATDLYLFAIINDTIKFLSQIDAPFSIDNDKYNEGLPFLCEERIMFRYRKETYELNILKKKLVPIDNEWPIELHRYPRSSVRRDRIVFFTDNAITLKKRETNQQNENKKKVAIVPFRNTINWIDTDLFYSIPQKYASLFDSVRNNPYEEGIECGVIELSSHNDPISETFFILDTCAVFHDIGFYLENGHIIVGFGLSDDTEKKFAHKIRVSLPKEFGPARKIYVVASLLFVRTEHSLYYLPAQNLEINTQKTYYEIKTYLQQYKKLKNKNADVYLTDQDSIFISDDSLTILQDKTHMIFVCCQKNQVIQCFDKTLRHKDNSSLYSIDALHFIKNTLFTVDENSILKFQLKPDDNGYWLLKKEGVLKVKGYDEKIIQIATDSKMRTYFLIGSTSKSLFMFYRITEENHVEKVFSFEKEPTSFFFVNDNIVVVFKDHTVSAILIDWKQ